MNQKMSKLCLALGCLLVSEALARGTPAWGAEFLTGPVAPVAAADPDATRPLRERLTTFFLNRRHGLPQGAPRIRGTWTLTGDLAQTTCPGEADLTTVSHTFTVEQNDDVLYVTSGAGIEFFGDLGMDGEFALATSTKAAPVSPSCVQEATLLMSGSFRDRRASFSIINELVGSCPDVNACELVYEGPFTRTRNGDGQIN